MTDDDYAQNVNAVVNNFLEQNKNLGEESTRYWDAITKRNYMFQKYQHIADHVKVTTKMQVLIFWDRYITKGSPHRTKLGIQVFSKARAELMETPVNAGVILVKDTLGFKRGMSLFPLSNTVDVEAMRTEQYTNTTEATGVE
jgi:insulysin